MPRPPPPDAPPRAQAGPAGPLVAAALAVLAAALLGWAATLHGLHFVDLVGFSRRARELAERTAPSDGLYPLGLPAWLALAHAFGLGQLAAARALSVATAALLVGATARRVGSVAAGWLLVQAPLLAWGSTEGTDIAAAALCLAAVLAAPRPLLAGLLLGLALSVRWTAAAWLLPVLHAVAAGDRKRVLPGLLVGLLPHLLASAWCGAFVLPDQSLNFAIAAGPGRPPDPGAAALLARLPRGLAEAARFAFDDTPSRAGAALLLAAALWPARTEADATLRRLARATALGAGLHLLGLAAVFANARLALPATLAALAGVGLAVERLACLRPAFGGAGRLAVGVAAAWFASRSLPALRDPPPGAESVLALHAALAACPPAGPAMANNAIVHTTTAGWIVPAVQLGGLRVTPRTNPAALGEIADRAGLRLLVLDPARARGQAGLEPLVRGTDTTIAGWQRCADGPWRVWTREAPPR